MIRSGALLTTLGLVGFGVLAPTPAQAFIYPVQFGEEVFEVGPIPDGFAKRPRLQGASAGFRCDVIGVLWAWIHRWDCEPVAFKGRSVFDNEKLNAAIGEAYSPDDVKLNWWSANGRWVLLAALIVPSWLGAVRRNRRRRAYHAMLAGLTEDDPSEGA